MNGPGSLGTPRPEGATPFSALAGLLPRTVDKGRVCSVDFHLPRAWCSEMKNSSKTILPSIDDIDRKWFVVDASDQVLGRLATRLATLLMGKDRPYYTDFLDTGAFVIVVNADKVRLTGKKWSQKVYYSHSRYPGGLKEITAENLLRRYPDRLVSLAVRGMLPKNKLGKRMLRKLKVYAGADHPHQAQQPEPLAL